MKLYNLNNFTRGWIVGDFNPSVFSLKDVEVAIKRYKAGDKEQKHYHKLADEMTIIISGTVTMNGVTLSTDDVVVIDKGEATDFVAITDAVTCVVKVPFARNDKYLV